MQSLGPWHLLIIGAVFVMFFGAKRLPEAARSLGRSARIVKAELKGMHDEPKPDDPVVTEATVRPLTVDERPVDVRTDGPR